jgi:hypothetical protein
VVVAVTVVLRVVTTVVALVSTYLAIAQHGYPAGHHTGPMPSFAAFGSAYPAAIVAFHAVTHVGWVWSSQVVRGVATVIGPAGLVHLADRDQGRETAKLAVTALVAFPTAFFLLAGYPESLALSFLIGRFANGRFAG